MTKITKIGARYRLITSNNTTTFRDPIDLVKRVNSLNIGHELGDVNDLPPIYANQINRFDPNRLMTDGLFNKLLIQ